MIWNKNSKFLRWTRANCTWATLRRNYVHTLISVSLYKVTDFLVEILINMTPQHVHNVSWCFPMPLSYILSWWPQNSIDFNMWIAIKIIEACILGMHWFYNKGTQSSIFQEKKTKEKFKTKSKTSIFKSDFFLFPSNSQDFFSKLSTH